MTNIDNQNSFNEVLTLIQKAKRKVYKQANNILIELYWDIGHYISDKTTKAGWGKRTVKELANYMKTKDASIGGFSEQNIWRMKQLYETYKDNEKLLPLVRELPQDTKDVFKDTYVLELLGVPKKHKEKDLQSAIVPILSKSLFLNLV